MADAHPGALSDPAALVEVRKVLPDVRIDLRYQTDQNFTHKVVYPAEARCYLRRAVAERLARVAARLRREGLGLKLWDCYRPLSVQRAFWALVPDERYVADPAKGSRHNRGAAVDLTLVDREGRELAMPTAHDDFSERARRDYPDLPPELVAHRSLLERAMAKEGFVGLPTEWWHFDGPGWDRYPLLDLPFEALDRSALR